MSVGFLMEAGLGLWPSPACLGTHCPGNIGYSGSGRRWGHSHGPVVPVHEDEEHGSQEEKDGQDNDGHLWT